MTTQEIYALLRTETYRDNTKFAGYVNEFDFDGYTSMCQIASRIESDKKFNRSCKRDGEYNKRTNYYACKRGW